MDVKVGIRNLAVEELLKPIIGRCVVIENYSLETSLDAVLGISMLEVREDEIKKSCGLYDFEEKIREAQALLFELNQRDKAYREWATKIEDRKELLREISLDTHSLEELISFHIELAKDEAIFQSQYAKHLDREQIKAEQKRLKALLVDALNQRECFVDKFDEKVKKELASISKKIGRLGGKKVFIVPPSLDFTHSENQNLLFIYSFAIEKLGQFFVSLGFKHVELIRNDPFSKRTPSTAYIKKEFISEFFKILSHEKIGDLFKEFLDKKSILALSTHSLFSSQDIPSTSLSISATLPSSR